MMNGMMYLMLYLFGAFANGEGMESSIASMPKLYACTNYELFLFLFLFILVG